MPDNILNLRNPLIRLICVPNPRSHPRHRLWDFGITLKV